MTSQNTSHDQPFGDPSRYPAPQPSDTFQGERMPLVAHPQSVIDALAAQYERLAADPFAGIPNAHDEWNASF